MRIVVTGASGNTGTPLLRLLRHEGVGIVVTRIRPGLIFQADAARCLADRFLRPIVPVRLLGRVSLPFLPIPTEAIGAARSVHIPRLLLRFAMWWSWRLELVDGMAAGRGVRQSPVLWPS